MGILKKLKKVAKAAVKGAVGFVTGGPVGAAVAAGSELLKKSKQSAEQAAASGNVADAKNAYDDSLLALQQLHIPELADLQTQLNQYVLQGEITPEEYIAALQEESAAEGIEIPEELLQVQHEALAQLKNIYDSHGNDPMFKAQMNDARDKMLTAQRGSNQALKQEFQARGLGGSGAEMAARLQSNSSQAQQASKAGFDIAAAAQQRALDALRQSTDLSGQMADRSLGVQATKAQATDAVNRFNTEARQRMLDANTKARNEAQAANLTAQQNIANKNVDVLNQQAGQHAGAVQQNYDNELKRAQALSAAGKQAGDAAVAAGERKDAKTGQLIDAAGNFLESDTGKKVTSAAVKLGGKVIKGIGKIFSDEEVKSDIGELTSDDVDSILERMTGHKYKYKPGYGSEGEHVGVIAQEVEQTPLRDMVSENEEGVKMVDEREAATAALAMLANIQKRVKKLEQNGAI